MLESENNRFLLYKLCFIILFQNHYALKDTIHKKNLQFVETLKQDLRRNNDDYADLRRSFSQTNNTLLNNVNVNDVRYKIITTRDNKKVTKSKQIDKTTSHNTNDKEDDRIKIIDNIRRRVNDALISKEVVNKAESVNQNKTAYNFDNNDDASIDRRLLDSNQLRPRSIWSDMHSLLLKNNNKITRMQLLNKTNGLPYLTTTTMTTTKSTLKKKHVKKNKMEKFKKFIHKNKNLLRDFISSKKMATNVSPTTLSTHMTFPQKLSKMLSGRQINNILREDATASLDKKSLMELPDADVLDMFPAKGGRIHSKRVNGHLCQRHVLIPEGPKYNSAGHIYLPPHAAANIAHEYNSTDAPKLLLPKCCNCCHKSVLGCE